ncbi:protein singed [Tetranychus urticae]|nr:protein singed [Tetranychus urticae]XP_015793520.1 protein singed [Tetranychus urticae]
MWSGTVGLVNGQHKYLTAETFGYKINANGVALKKKQQWSIEPFPLNSASNGASNGNGLDELAELEIVALKSHLGCYLEVDNFGNVICENKERSEGARFIINICVMSNEKGVSSIYWAFRNISRGYYLGATGDGMTCCVAKQPQSRAELWHVHLVPARGATMFALKSVGRKRYARTQAVESSQNGTNNKPSEPVEEQVQVDATTPWGSETLFQFKYYESGRYALLTSTCKYLTSEGNCIEFKGISSTNGSNGSNGVAAKIAGFTNGSSPAASNTSALPPAECLFTIEYHGGFIAFRDINGRYLAGTGRSSVLRTRSNNVSRDELFTFEEAPIQIALRAGFNNKWVSVKQGVDLSANQNEITTQFETFQLQYDKGNDTWHILTKDGNYWALGAASTIQASSRDEKSGLHFKLKWNDDGTCSILLSSDPGASEDDMKWICNRKSGQLCIGTSDPVKFYLMFRNRTSLNLRSISASGFIGLKGPGSGKLESSKTSPDSIKVEYCSAEGVGDSDDDAPFSCCFFKMPVNNKYWSIVDAGSVACDSSSPTCAQRWVMELRTGSCIAIRAYETGSYLTLTGQGAIQVSNVASKDATLWEF